MNCIILENLLSFSSYLPDQLRNPIYQGQPRIWYVDLWAGPPSDSRGSGRSGSAPGMMLVSHNYDGSFLQGIYVTNKRYDIKIVLIRCWNPAKQRIDAWDWRQSVHMTKHQELLGGMVF